MKTIRFILQALLISSLIGGAAFAQDAPVLSEAEAQFVATAIAGGADPKKAIAAARAATANGTIATADPVSTSNAVSDAVAAEVPVADVQAAAAEVVAAAASSGDTAAVQAVSSAITTTVVAEAADPVAAAESIAATITTAAVEAAPAGQQNAIASVAAQGASAGAVSGAQAAGADATVATAVANAAVQSAAQGATNAGATNTAQIVLESSVAATDAGGGDVVVDSSVDVTAPPAAEAPSDSPPAETPPDIEPPPTDNVVVIKTATFHLVTVSIGDQRVNLVITEGGDAAEPIAAVVSTVTVGTSFASTSGTLNFDAFPVAEINAFLQSSGTNDPNFDNPISANSLRLAVETAINNANIDASVFVQNNAIVVSPSS